MKKPYQILILLLLSFTGFSQDTLFPKFKNPPDNARPRVWWHWMNGNITKEGIQKDLEWMKRVGIGGFQNFDASLFTPQIVQDRLTYMTPKWKEAFQFTTQLADKLNLEMAIAASPGWSVTGGPWVPAKDGMKKYVWTETKIKGGQNFIGKLPQPPSNPGTIQNVIIEKDFAIGTGVADPPSFYEDAAVIAYRIPETDLSLAELKPKVASSSGSFDITTLTDGDLAKSIYLPPTAVGENAWIQFEFDRPQTFKALTIVGGGGGPNFAFFGGGGERTLTSSNDGINFSEVIKIPVSGIAQNTITFTPTTAKYFRVLYKTLQPSPNPILMLAGLPMEKLEPKGTDVSEIVLHTSYRINRLEEKAGFTISRVPLSEIVTPETSDAISPDHVIDLTSKMKPDGSIEWNVPAGNWNILRWGYSLTGRQNHPASPEATGLEVDKLDATAVKDYMENYLDQYKSATGGLMGKKGLQYMVTDSYEAGHMVWTKNMLTEFSKRRGYDMKTWMPVLTGHIVKSTEASEQFLWDFRKTLGDLVVENHYDQIGDLLHKRGMGRYSESHENGRALIADGMEIKRKADIPMSAMWTPGSLGSGPEETNGYKMDIKESASVAHIYGQNFVAAESMTAIGNTWAFSPERLKRTADMEMAMGLNRFVIHTSVHQPSDEKFPGLGLGPFGQWFTRHETWGEQAKPWMDYLARSCYMLQQGKFVADVLYFYGEDNNITNLFSDNLPTIPEGYNYDFVNADALINVMTVKDGNIITPNEMSYKVLVLDANAKIMSLPVLKKIRDMVKAGATITGAKPERTPSLSDDQKEFQAIVHGVWETNNSRVMRNQPLGSVLTYMKIGTDFSYTKPQANTQLLYVHRKLKDQDIYWVDNRNDRVENVEATFRVEGKVPEIWHADTGAIEQASYQIKNGTTTVALHLEPFDAVFVIFKNKAAANSFTKAKPVEPKTLGMDGPWTVSFQKGRGAPATATFAQLQSWTESQDNGIKYFSGTASYSTTFTAAEVKKGATVEIDLGEVKNLAEVILNGKSLGIVWKKPFKIIATSALKAGKNTLEVKVTNLWVNRLIGDQQPNATKITYTTQAYYKADAPLLPSGLMGPVILSY